jgi:hypothetical protein
MVKNKRRELRRLINEGATLEVVRAITKHRNICVDPL